MAFEAKILADSINVNAQGAPGGRLTTMELAYPRCIHSEFMTHRKFSRNAASSRAIPIEKMLSRILEDPFVPIYWGTNQKGMQAEHASASPDVCEQEWLTALHNALEGFDALHGLGLHKQIVNRLLEPWMWITVIATATDDGWENFFKLRCHKDAEPHIQKIAYMSRDIFDSNTPVEMSNDRQAHLPLIGFDGDELLSFSDKVSVSVGRCARVSYLTHEGIRDVQSDITLHDRLAKSGHWSPFEHVAFPVTKFHGMGSNLSPFWQQYRKRFPTEYCIRAPRENQNNETIDDAAADC